MDSSITDRAKALGLPSESFVVVGSGILDALGIRKARDLDLCVSKNLYEQLKKIGWRENSKDGENYLLKDDTEVWLTFDSRNFNELKQYSQNIDGVNFMTLDFIKDWKNRRGKEKDQRDLALIQKFLDNKDSIN
jgi:hypothetical protein